MIISMSVSTLILRSLLELWRNEPVLLLVLHTTLNLKINRLIITDLNIDSFFIIVNRKSSRVRQLMHVFMQTVQPSLFGQLPQTFQQIIQNAFVEQNCFSLIELEKQSMITCEWSVVIFSVGWNDNDSSSIMIHFWGRLEFLSGVNAIFFLEYVLNIQILKNLSTNLPVEFGIKDQFNIFDGLKFFKEAANSSTCES